MADWRKNFQVFVCLFTVNRNIFTQYVVRQTRDLVYMLSTTVSTNFPQANVTKRRLYLLSMIENIGNWHFNVRVQNRVISMSTYRCKIKMSAVYEYQYEWIRNRKGLVTDLRKHSFTVHVLPTTAGWPCPFTKQAANYWFLLVVTASEIIYHTNIRHVS